RTAWRTAGPTEESEEQGLDLAFARRVEPADLRLGLRGAERLAELSLDEAPLRLFHDARRARLGDSLQRAQRSQIQLVFFGDDFEKERHGAHVADLPDRLQDRLAQRSFVVEREDGRERGAVADFAERLDGVKLQPDVAALQNADEVRECPRVAKLAQR